MHKTFSAGVAVASLVLAVGCGGTSSDAFGDGQPQADGGGAAGVGGSGGAGGGDPSPDQACTDLAAGYCGTLNGCFPLLVQITFGDEPTCLARAKIGCLTAMNAPGSGATSGAIEACAAAAPGITCAELLANQTASACIPSGGQLAAGSPCGQDWQCASSRCSTAKDQPCGSCKAFGGPGDACVADLDCAHGSVCAKKTSTCAIPGAAGASCDDAHPCIGNLSCEGTPGAKTCAAAGGPGAPCDAQEVTKAGCDFTQGLFCNPYTSVCQKIALASAGEPCGLSSTGYAACVGASTCKLASATAGTCVAPAADGAACDPSASQKCLPGATCSGGVCKVDDAAACK